MLFYNFHRISFFLYFLGDRKSMRFMLKAKKDMKMIMILALMNTA